MTNLGQCELQIARNTYNPCYSVRVKNDFDPEAIQGGSVTVDQTTYHNIPVEGKEFVWRTYQQPHTITAVDYQEIPENNVVYVREYQRWRNEFGDLLAERPHLSFNPPITPPLTQRTYIASFLKLFNVTFGEPNYIDGPASGGYYKVEGEPANSTVIRQDESKLIEAIPPEGWFFVAWSDNHADKYTNPRTLAPTDHIENLSATFKKHLGSSLASATGTNSQRKLSVDKGEIDSKAALTYASGREIWLSESDVSLGTFTNEFRVSNGSGNFGFPSVVATSSIGIPPGPGDGFTNSPPYIAVVYQKTFENGLQVYFREKSGETWENPATLESYNFGVVDATPVIGRTGCEHFPKFTVVWVRGEGLKYRHRSSGTWNPSPQGVPGSTSGDVRPSISTGYMNYDPNYHGTAPLFLSYDNGTSVFLQRINGGTFQTRETIWQTTGTFAGKSQVAADTRNPSELHAHVVWENLS
ncbi:hypothetical protein FBQ87_14570, partial [Sphingobacteriales bacterium CHB3]|nr:hypothetical protein [Sphingobacteriales bacterium CHB3]